jgi:hypothetical protein
VRRLRATARTFKVTDRTLLVAGGILAPVGILVIIIGWWGAAHSPFLFQQVPYLISGGLLGLALVILGSFLYFGYWLTQVVKEQRRQATAVVEAIERLERVAAGLAGSRTPARNGHTPTPAPEPGQPAALEPPPEARPTDSGTQSAPEAEWRSPVGSATQAASRASAELATRTSADIGRTSEDTATQAATGASTHTATQAVPGVVEQPNSELSPAKGPGASGDPLLDTLVTTPNEVFVATAKGTMAHHRDCVVVAGKTGLRYVTKADGLAACKLCAPYDA